MRKKNKAGKENRLFGVERRGEVIIFKIRVRETLAEKVTLKKSSEVGVTSNNVNIGGGGRNSRFRSLRLKYTWKRVFIVDRASRRKADEI